MQGCVYSGDNLPLLRAMASESVDLVYMDPPFNTGKVQRQTRLRNAHTTDEAVVSQMAYSDIFTSSVAYHDFLKERLFEICRLMAPHASLYVHLDYREVHYVKILLDQIFGRESFINEIIWAYDYGAKPKTKWPCKHDNILLYCKNPHRYYFNADAVEREPYMAPGLVTPEKVARGKMPTDVWWHTIVATNSRERTGYPTQKPEGILRRMITASSRPGDLVLDPFAGSGTTGAVCLRENRRFVLIDNNAEALATMRTRFADRPVKFVEM